MKALKILKDIKIDEVGLGLELNPLCVTDDVEQAIKELEAYITNYQGTKRRLDNIVTAIAVLQHQNKSLVKTLEKYNEEMIDLRKENQDLKNSNNELLEGLISTQKRLEEWLEKCK